MKKNLLFSFVLSLFTLAVFAQSKRVTGKVTAADDGTGLPGVSVTLKGVSKGTQTGVDGTYAIDVPASGGTLVFSFVGMANQQIKVGTQSVINVSMVGDNKQLSEVVVTGTGTATSKKKLGISV